MKMSDRKLENIQQQNKKNIREKIQKKIDEKLIKEKLDQKQAKLEEKINEKLIEKSLEKTNKIVKQKEDKKTIKKIKQKQRKETSEKQKQKVQIFNKQRQEQQQQEQKKEVNIPKTSRDRYFSLTALPEHKMPEKMRQYFKTKIKYTEQPDVLFPRSPILYPKCDQSEGRFYTLFCLRSTNPKQQISQSLSRFKKLKELKEQQQKKTSKVMIPPVHPIYCDVCQKQLCYSGHHNSKQQGKCSDNYFKHICGKVHIKNCQNKAVNACIHELAKKFSMNRRPPTQNLSKQQLQRVNKRNSNTEENSKNNC